MEEEYEIIDKSSTICPICFDKQGKFKIKLECGHTIHPQCLKQWISDKSYIDLKCPSCKQKINKDIDYTCHICKKNNYSFNIQLSDGRYICPDCI